MKTILIGGMGNVLLGDDGFGPYVIHLLESRYEFEENVELADLGTPALDLTHRIAGRDVVILIDCIASNAQAPGTVLLYDKAGLVSAIPAQRLDPHSPALSECLLAAEMLGSMPGQVMLFGAIGESFDLGCPLSPAMRQACEKVMESVLVDLERLGVTFHKRLPAGDPGIWWQQGPDLTACPRAK